MEAKDIGKWAFLIGVILAILSAFTVNYISPITMGLILFVLGLIVGFLNITRKNVSDFLIATLVLLVLGVGGIGALSEVSLLGIYDYLAAMLTGFVTFVGAAALVVSIKAIIQTNEGLFGMFK